MHGKASILSRILMVAAFCGGVPGVTFAQAFRAEVRGALATPAHADDPEVVIINLDLDLRLTNRSMKAAEVPKRQVNGSEATAIAVLGVESKQVDGNWTTLVRSSWYDAGTNKYESCRSLSPGEALEFRNVPGEFVLLRRQFAGLANDPTVRLRLMVVCRNSDGKVLTAEVITDAFRLRLSAQH